MADQFLTYTKRSDFLVCVDSDGCAMDTMDIKHIRCFGPCMVAEWGLEEWRDAILERWNEINLYTMTRGVNRFKGLAKALGEIQEKYCEIEELGALEQWVQESTELSNAALERELARNDNICLRKALAWSNAVNQSIDRLPEEDKRPFPGVLEALKRAYRDADIAIVSSANLSAVLDEWDFYGLLEYTDVVLAQDSGSKAFCIGELMKRGYAPDHVLMCGDAPGDLDAAEKNGVYYYPILVRHEEQSWAEFVQEGIMHFLDGTYGEGYQQEKKEQFLRNLGKK
ncbi:MAG: HAD family hydrolase [Lachnospiraceae bacterium]|nr:HAD family hydrolase [Lachnospiraceae bacterium]